eukprot:20185-Heterococcus_DN1.PRE.5
MYISHVIHQRTTCTASHRRQCKCLRLYSRSRWNGHYGRLYSHNLSLQSIVDCRNIWRLRNNSRLYATIVDYDLTIIVDRSGVRPLRNYSRPHAATIDYDLTTS